VLCRLARLRGCGTLPQRKIPQRCTSLPVGPSAGPGYELIGFSRNNSTPSARAVVGRVSSEISGDGCRCRASRYRPCAGDQQGERAATGVVIVRPALPVSGRSNRILALRPGPSKAGRDLQASGFARSEGTPESAPAAVVFRSYNHRLQRVKRGDSPLHPFNASILADASVC